MSTPGVFSSPGDIMSTVRAYHDECGGYHEYNGGIGTQRGYHEYTRGCSVHCGDILSTLGAYHDECGGYH